MDQRCIELGEGASAHFAPLVTYDFSTVNPALLQSLHYAADTQGVVFFLKQQSPNPPTYLVLVEGSMVGVNSSNGDIVLTPADGTSLDVQARIAIIDSFTSGRDSAEFAWNADATKSVGAALVGGDGCPTADNCPDAEPPRWPSDFANYSRQILPAGGYTWLAFDFPSVGTNTYKYWLRAFGAGAPYDIDPKIKNQPT